MYGLLKPSDYIRHYYNILEKENKLSYTRLMYELMNEFEDEDLKDMGVDIIDIADMVCSYMENKGV